MDTKPSCDFSRIVPGSETSNPCSPEVQSEFRGLKLAAPEEVRFGPGTEDMILGGFARIIVAGVCRLEYPALGLRGEWNRSIVLVATESRTKRVYSGKLQPLGSPAPPDDPLAGSGVDASAFAGAVVGTFFNPNIARDLSLPAAEADYDVYATLGPHRSNLVHIKVRRLQ